MIGRYGLNQKFDVKLTCTVETCLGQGMRMLKGMEVVFLCGIHSHDRNRILKYCVANDISAYVIPRIGDVLMSGAKRRRSALAASGCIPITGRFLKRKIRKRWTRW